MEAAANGLRGDNLRAAREFGRGLMMGCFRSASGQFLSRDGQSGPDASAACAN